MPRDNKQLCFTVGNPYCPNFLDSWEGGTYGMKVSHIWCKLFHGQAIKCLPKTGPIEEILTPDGCPYKVKQMDLFALGVGDGEG